MQVLEQKAAVVRLVTLDVDEEAFHQFYRLAIDFTDLGIFIITRSRTSILDPITLRGNGWWTIEAEIPESAADDFLSRLKKDAEASSNPPRETQT